MNRLHIIGISVLFVSAAFGSPEPGKVFSGILTYEYERSLGGTHSVSGVITFTVNDRFARKQFLPDSFFQLDLRERAWFHVGWTSIQRLNADEFSSGTHHLRVLEERADHEVDRLTDGVSFRAADGSILIEIRYAEDADLSSVLEVFDVVRFARRYADLGELRIPEELRWRAGGRTFSMRLVESEAKELDASDFVLPDRPTTSVDLFRIASPESK